MIPSKVKKNLLEQSEIIQKQFEAFVKDRINPERTNQYLVTNEGKKAPDMENHEEEDQGFKFRPNSGVTRRQKPVCTHDGDMKSRPKIDIQEAVGTYEFTVVLISMFATDGEMPH